MIKIFLVAGVALLLYHRSLGQTGFNDSLALSRNTYTRNAMTSLGGFAVANIAAGFIAAGQTRGETRYFWRMNAYWNLVNLGVAAMGYLGAQRALGRTYTLAQNEKAQLAVEKTYVLNFGLDLVYITGGFYLRERGLSESNPVSRDQYRGYGSSIALQGGFLAVMDGIMVMLHHHNSIRLNRHLQGLAWQVGPGTLGLTYNL
jgi:hypothetical protein